VVRWDSNHELDAMGAVGPMVICLDDCDSGARLMGKLFCRADRAAFIGGGALGWAAGGRWSSCVPIQSGFGATCDPDNGPAADASFYFKSHASRQSRASQIF
jgi:hypothetical protein